MSSDGQDGKRLEAGTAEKLLDEQTGKKIESQEAKKKKKTGTIFLYISALSACMLSFGLSSSIVWTSPVIAKLRTNDSDVNPLGKPITTFQESMIGSLPFIGGAIGSATLAKLSDLIGRQRTMLILAVLQLAATLLLAFSTEVLWYYVTRFAMGVGMSSAISTLGVFLSEISEDRNRGRIGSLMGLSFPLGNLYVYVLGPLFSVKIFTVLCALPFVLSTVSLLVFVPESPIYLASKGRRKEAVRSLEKLRGKSASEIEKEYEVIEATLNSTTDKAHLSQFFHSRPLRKGLVITIVSYTLLQFSGVGAITTFAGPLFDAANTGMTGNTIAILMGIVKLCSVFLATVTVEKLGKRPLLLISTLGAGVAHGALGAYFYLNSANSPLVKYILWLPLAAILLYFVFYGVGIGAVIPSLPGELFPTNIKSVATSIGAFVIFSTGILVAVIFPYFIRTIGPAWCLWGFGLSCILGFFFVYFMIPEIKGKSIIEIQELLSR